MDFASTCTSSCTHTLTNTIETQLHSVDILWFFFFFYTCACTGWCAGTKQTRDFVITGSDNQADVWCKTYLLKYSHCGLPILQCGNDIKLTHLLPACLLLLMEVLTRLLSSLAMCFSAVPPSSFSSSYVWVRMEIRFVLREGWMCNKSWMHFMQPWFPVLIPKPHSLHPQTSTPCFSQ